MANMWKLQIFRTNAIAMRVLPLRKKLPSSSPVIRLLSSRSRVAVRAKPFKKEPPSPPPPLATHKWEDLQLIAFATLVPCSLATLWAYKRHRSNDSTPTENKIAGNEEKNIPFKLQRQVLFGRVFDRLYSKKSISSSRSDDMHIPLEVANSASLALLKNKAFQEEESQGETLISKPVFQKRLCEKFAARRDDELSSLVLDLFGVVALRKEEYKLLQDLFHVWGAGRSPTDIASFAASELKLLPEEELESVSQEYLCSVNTFGDRVVWEGDFVNFLAVLLRRGDHGERCLERHLAEILKKEQLQKKSKEKLEKSIEISALTKDNEIRENMKIACAAVLVGFSTGCAAFLFMEEIDVSKYGHDQYTLVDEGAADTTNGKWSLSLVAAEMKVTSGTCGLGAVGVLCHACDASAGFVPGDSGGACILCNNALDVTTTQIVLLAVGTPLLFMILFIFFIKRAPSQMKDPNDIKSSDRIHHLRHELSRHVESPEKLFESMIRCGDDTNDLKSGGVYKEDDVDREMKKAFEDADASSDDDDDQKDVSRRGMGFSSRGEELFVGRKEFKHILLQQIYSEAAHRERLLRKGIREKKKKLGKEGSTKWSE
eukprot:g2058.t1